MNRRGFFSALVGGIAAATGLRSLIGRPARRAGRWVTSRNGAAKLYDLAGADVRADRVVFLKKSAMGKSELMLNSVGDALARSGTAPWREPRDGLAWSVGRDLPEVWPGRSAEITATVALPPLAQVERLVELFGASGDDAPAFAAALIGELVLTRLRLADLRRIHAPTGLAS